MKRSKPYVGVGSSDGAYVFFKAKHMPTRETHGQDFTAVIGPFRSTRGAMWAARYGKGNPHFRSLRDAEALAKAQEERETSCNPPMN